MRIGKWFPAAVAAALLIAAAVARVAGIDFQLWLDEIWSIRLAQTARTPMGVFYLHHDNNHWLNTLWLMCLGPGRPWWTYHLLAEVTGIGTVLLGWLVSRKNMAVLILLGASEFLIEFSTDARGYAPAGFFALLCLWLLEQHLARPRRITAVLMSVSAVLGLLSHLTFVVILGGLIASSVVALRRRRRSWPTAVAQTIVWWWVPIALIVAVYCVDVRYMIRGGGPPTPSDLASQAAAMILGVPVGSVAAPILGIVAYLLCARQHWRMFRSGDPAWPLYLIVLLLVPIVLFFWPKTDYVHPRYIYVAVPLMLVLLGRELSRHRVLAVPLLLAYCVCNGLLLANLFRYGRGDYLGALNDMLDNTTAPNVVIDAHDQRDPTMMVLQYYDRHPPHPARHVFTLKSSDWGDQWPQWMITVDDHGPRITTSGGVQFVRQAQFPKGAVTSGIPWTIYEAASGGPSVRHDDLYDLSP